MLFDIKEFEQYFEERTLKKGLKLFQQGAVELIEKHNASELRFAGAGAELQLGRRGDKIMHYDCSCGNISFCQHFAAALFLLQKETLSTLPRKRTDRSEGNKQSNVFKNTTTAELIAFIKEPSRKLRNKVPLENALMHFGEETCFENYCVLFKILFSPYYFHKALNQQLLDEAHKHISLFTRKLKNIRTPFNSNYYLHLALLTELQDLLQLRLTGNESKIESLRQNCYEILESCFNEGLQAAEKSAWYAALRRSLRNNNVARSGAYSFLLPRFLSWSRSRPAFEELRLLLAKRGSNKLYHTHFNSIAIATFQLAVKERDVFKTRLSKPDAAELMDENRARCELAFCAGRISKAFSLIESGLELATSSHKIFFDEHTTYAISKAVQYNKPQAEMKYLKERIVKGLYLQPHDLERWMELIPEPLKEQRITELIDELKHPRYYSFEKLWPVLLRTHRFDGLITEIKKQDNAYRLLHQLVLKKLPAFDKQMLLLYATQFCSAMSAIKIYNHQQTLFETAREYLDKLPQEARLLILDKIITNSGSESQISRYIREVYRLG